MLTAQNACLANKNAACLNVPDPSNNATKRSVPQIMAILAFIACTEVRRSGNHGNFLAECLFCKIALCLLPFFLTNRRVSAAHFWKWSRTTLGSSGSFLSLIAIANRTNWALVQASGVADPVPCPNLSHGLGD